MAEGFNLKLLLRLLGLNHLVMRLLPGSLLQVRIGILHTLVVQVVGEMKDLKKKKRDIADKKRRQEQY